MSNETKRTQITIDIGLRIKNARKKRLLKSVEFAKILSIAPSTLSNWEAGKAAFTADHITDLARHLHVSPAWLLSGDEVAPPTEADGAIEGPGPDAQLVRTNRAFFSLVSTLQHVQLQVQEGRLPIETYRNLVAELLTVVQAHKVDLLSEPDEGSLRVS